MAHLKLLNIEKVYPNGTKAVENISFEVAEGEFVVLVGPSGCGKTTILRMIAGLEDISNGEIYLDTKIINNLSPKDRNIGMVFQNYALYPHLTVFENLAFPLQIQKIKKFQIKSNVEKISELLQISDCLYKKPKELSGGQRQRVALGRALIRQPRILLFDEPLSNLDAKLRVEMRTEITKLHRSLNAISIYVTHDQIEAMTMATKIIILNNGKIQQIGSPEEIYNLPKNKFVASFIGSTPINFFDCKLLEQNDSCTSFSLTNGEMINIQTKRKLPEKFTLAIRPENLSVSQMQNSNSIKGKVVNIENLGYEKNLYFEYGKSLYSCKSNIENPININDDIFISFLEDKLLFYNEQGELIN
ncbi:MAG: ABC transporter ATP-binding protein [Ignavibacteria bacterium]|nr:ABC transporter ATP-binding protein [Ignavibacteria bacterium]